MKNVFVSQAVWIVFAFIILVHPRPRLNLDLNFGEAVGGRITVEVPFLCISSF